MKLHIFGTQAESTPQPGCSSIAWALEKDGMIHWFDAGERCSRTAYFMGVKKEQLCRLFISRFHPDFCSGLTGLLAGVKQILPVYTPAENVLKCFAEFFLKLDGSSIELQEQFMGKQGNAEQCGVNVSWRAAEKGYIFRIEAEKRKIVYAPSAAGTEELGDWLRDPDILIWGTGKMGAVEICRRIKHEKRHVGKLILMCHDGAGSEEDVRSKVADIFPAGVYFAEDAQTFEL